MLETAQNTRYTVIISDLDGTLLDRDTYSYHAARNALYAVQGRGIPVVFCSSKTRAEQMVYRNLLAIRDPFIVEDGGAIFIPMTYFPFPFTFQRSIDDYHVIELGTPYGEIRQAVEEVRSETGVALKGYGDMIPAEVAEVTGLDRDGAYLAMKREYQETIVSLHSPDELDAVAAGFSRRGLRLTKGGRFLAVSGVHDKGAAVDVLAALYRQAHGNVRLVGIGDSYNDLAMLSAVDVPVLVQKAPETWEEIRTPDLIRVDGVGPEGWNRFVIDYVSQMK
jgi:mannosyl-3-phosphoglycerate phosphatase